MSKTDDDRKSASDKARDLAALRDAASAFVPLLVFQGSLILLNPDGETTGWFLLWSFSPLVPALWLMWTQLRSLPLVFKIAELFSSPIESLFFPTEDQGSAAIN